MWQARGGLVCGVRSRNCRERQEEREKDREGRQAGSTGVRCLLPASFDILIFDIYYAGEREREMEREGGGRGGMTDKHSGRGVMWHQRKLGRSNTQTLTQKFRI